MTLKEKIINGLQGLVAASILSLPISIPITGDLLKSPKDYYHATEITGFSEGDTKEVTSYEESYKYAEPWRVLTHYYNPQIVRDLSFEDGSSAKVQFSLLTDSSIFRRKVFGPKVGDTYTLDGNLLKRE